MPEQHSSQVVIPTWIASSILAALLAITVAAGAWAFDQSAAMSGVLVEMRALREENYQLIKRIERLEDLLFNQQRQ